MCHYLLFSATPRIHKTRNEKMWIVIKHTKTWLVEICSNVEGRTLMFWKLAMGLVLWYGIQHELIVFICKKMINCLHFQMFINNTYAQTQWPIPKSKFLFSRNFLFQYKLILQGQSSYKLNMCKVAIWIKHLKC
jgi:hypothetical protein